MIRQKVVDSYKEVKDKDYFDWSAIDFAGKYLYEYPEDPMSALINDIVKMRVPSVIGRQAKVILLAVLKSENKE